MVDAALSSLPRWVSRAALLAGALALLVSLPWERLDHEFVWDRAPVADTGPQQADAYTREVLHLNASGTRIEAWLYLPRQRAGEQPPPVLVMAHGMGAQKDIGLFTYAEKFVRAGLAVLVFDYRTFGGSEGLPRHWVSPGRHLEDWSAVVQHVKDTALDGRVDGSRIALWGVSYAGGHVLVTAARFGDAIAAVIANEPYVSPAAVLNTLSLRGITRSLRLLALGISDELRRLLSTRLGLPLQPIYLRLVAPITDPNAIALLPLQESEMAIRSKGVPPRRQGGWQNKVLARIVLEALGYNPSKWLAQVKAPIFFRLATLDHLCPPSVVRGALDKAALPPSQYEIQEREVTHLEAHSTGVQEEDIAPALAFLRKHLGLGSGDAGAAAGGGKLSAGKGAQELAEPQF